MKRLQKLVQTAALTAAVAMSLSPVAAVALPDHELETFYYSDATHTNQVGYKFQGCFGDSYATGIPTAYKTFVIGADCN